MEQPGFCDIIDREALLEKVGDPLPKIAAIVDWEGLRSELERFRDRTVQVQSRAQAVR